MRGKFGCTVHIRAWGEEANALKQNTEFRARRGVVERTHRWMHRFRRVRIRGDKIVRTSLGVLPLACGYLTNQQSDLIGRLIGALGRGGGGLWPGGHDGVSLLLGTPSGGVSEYWPEVEFTLDNLAPNRLILGDPETCVGEFQRWQEATGTDYVLLRLRHAHSGGPPHEKIMQTLKLFGERVLPYCR